MNASLSVLAETVEEPRKLVLDSKDINAISTFAQKRIRLPKEFLLARASTLEISDDARAIIYILLGSEMEVTINDNSREMLREIAENFSVWAASTALGSRDPNKYVDSGV